MIKREFLITVGMVWPVSYEKWKAPLDSYFRVIQVRNIRTRPYPKPTTPTPQINPTPSIKRCVTQTRIDHWNNLPNENITSVSEIYLQSKTVKLLMCDFISDEIYLKSAKKWSRPDMIPIFSAYTGSFRGLYRQSTVYKGIQLWKTIKTRPMLNWGIAQNTS